MDTRTVGPKHYRSMAAQPIDFILDNDIGYCEGNVIKYIVRWRKKGGLEDLRKAQHYIDFLIAQELEAAAKEEEEKNQRRDDDDSIYTALVDEPPF
jgi:hypothetical protein